MKREQSKRRWTSLRGQSSPMMRLPAVTSSPSDPYDFLDLLSYLAETIDGATHGGVAHGSMARLHSICRPSPATVKSSDAIYRTKETLRL